MVLLGAILALSEGVCCLLFGVHHGWVNMPGSTAMQMQTRAMNYTAHSNGDVVLHPRPGVQRVIDEAADLGLKLSVCTTNEARDSLVHTLNKLLVRW